MLALLCSDSFVKVFDIINVKSNMENTRWPVDSLKYFGNTLATITSITFIVNTFKMCNICVGFIVQYKKEILE